MFLYLVYFMCHTWFLLAITTAASRFFDYPSCVALCFFFFILLLLFCFHLSYYNIFTSFSSFSFFFLFLFMHSKNQQLVLEQMLCC